MSVNEDNYGPSSDSFWDIDGYKAAVKRQEDGVRLCNELMSLIQERSDMEKAYAKSLQTWNKKWMQMIDKGPEYGTTQAAWKGVLHEAERIAAIHAEIRDSLINDVQVKVKDWKQNNFKKGVVGPCKETKHLEEEFKKAQKPWAKKYVKVKEAKKQYHNACKLQKSCTNQENNARADSSLSADQIMWCHLNFRENFFCEKTRWNCLKNRCCNGASFMNYKEELKKIQDKAEKCHKDVESTRNKYEGALSDLNSYNPKYMEDMTMVFQKSDQNEEKRLVFVKEMLFGIHKCLDTSQNVQIAQIYNQLHHTVDQADYNQDLKWWSQNHGKDMGMNWPQFEEFREEMHDITRQKSRDHDAVGQGGIMLRRINTDRHRQEFAEYQEGHHNISRREKSKAHTVGNDGIMLTGLKTDNSQPPPSYNTVAANGSSAAPPPPVAPSHDQNPFGSDDFDEDEQIDTSGGTPVRAIYDYVGQEEDELSFKEGEVFMKLKDRDAQGWCTGIKDGHVGLYPDNYVQNVD